MIIESIYNNNNNRNYTTQVIIADIIHTYKFSMFLADFLSRLYLYSCKWHVCI